MSHAATNWAFELPSLSCTQKMVLLCLANCHHPVFGCFPSQAYIAEVCNIDRATVNRALNELVSRGLIQRERDHDEQTKKRKSTRYYLAFEGEKAMSHSAQKPCRILHKSHVAQCDTKLVIDKLVKDTVSDTLSDEFEKFWSEYPNRVGKPVARRAYMGARRRATHEKIMAGLSGAKQGGGWRDVKYIPHPSTWLNRDGWDDAPAISVDNLPKKQNEIDWNNRVMLYHQDKTWLTHWGDRPPSKFCDAPVEILKKYGYRD
jgi:DNA-binding MarR family transcriptional regulator